MAAGDKQQQGQQQQQGRQVPFDPAGGAVWAASRQIEVEGARAGHRNHSSLRPGGLEGAHAQSSS
jgi:hypothetical protein